MRFAIISDIHHGSESPYKGVIRKLSRYSMPLLSEAIEKLNADFKPSFVINQGDAINDETHEIDTIKLQEVHGAFQKLEAPLYHLIGNHEQLGFTNEQLEEIIRRKPLYYSFDVEAYHIVVLFSDSIYDKQRVGAKIDDVQKNWLQADLAATDKKTLMFVHHPLADQDLTGNFWFDGKPEHALMLNRAEIRSIIEDSRKVIAVFNGHTHWNKMDVHEGIPYFTIQSLIENFNDDGTPAGCYAIVEISDTAIDVDVLGADSAKHHFVLTKRI